MSKDLLTYFVFATLRNNFDVMLKNAVKKKLSENQKKQNHAQVSHLFKNSFMLKNMEKKLPPQTRFFISFLTPNSNCKVIQFLP